MYEVVLKILNTEKKFTIQELIELKKILENNKDYEEMIDWFAIQIPKIVKVYEELHIL